MQLKKLLPIALVQIIEEALKDSPVSVKAEKEDGSIVILRERWDLDSPFFFRLDKINPKSNGTTYEIAAYPAFEDNLIQLSMIVTLEQFRAWFESWVRTLEAYSNPSEVFDDPILQSYYEDLGPKFHIDDPRADKDPYGFEEQKALRGLFDVAVKVVEAHAPNVNQQEAHALIEEIQTAKEEMSRSTKAQVVSRLRKIIAMGRKLSYDVAEELLVVFLSEKTKWLLAGAASLFL